LRPCALELIEKKNHHHHITIFNEIWLLKVASEDVSGNFKDLRLAVLAGVNQPGIHESPGQDKHGTEEKL
jgi:hypothetical protein